MRMAVRSRSKTGTKKTDFQVAGFTRISYRRCQIRSVWKFGASCATRGAVYHVMRTENRGSALFTLTTHKGLFFRTLEEAIERTAWIDGRVLLAHCGKVTRAMHLFKNPPSSIV